MKKTLVALAVSGLVAAVNAAPQANTFYAGAKAGWASFHDGINQMDSKYANDARYANVNVDKYGINRNSVTYGVFGGYQIIDNLAVELGYDYFGRVRGNNQDVRAFKHSAHGTHLSLKPSYEVAKGLDLYGKVGAALIRSDYKDYAAKEKFHNLKTSLLLGAGVEYAITKELALRTEYQWTSRIGNQEKAERKAGQTSDFTAYSPDSHSVSVGLTYRFGQGAAPVAAPVAAAQPEVVNKTFTFGSDVLFDFGKANLKPAATTALDSVYSEIQSYGLTDAALKVNGYTDRIGKDEPNKVLSQRRAESVANYLVSKGVNPASIQAVGYGKASPKTGNQCDAVKGRQALIACLAPDRRVDVQVQGTKQVAM